MNRMLDNLLEQKTLVKEYLRKDRHSLSSFSFAAIFNWQDFFEFEFKMIKGNLCIFARNEMGVFLYLPPLGKMIEEETIEQCFLLMNEENKGRGLSRIENVSSDQLEAFSSLRYSFYRKGFEYGYFRKDIAFLKGNSYKSKRSSCNHFVKNYKFEYLPFDPAMLAGCLDLYDDWAGTRRQLYADEIYRQMLMENRRVHEITLRHSEDLDLTGRVVRVNGQIKAYTFGFEINQDIFCVLFEIADVSVKGLPVFIFSRFCRDEALRKYNFINVMDDCELKNIQAVKLSFHPVLVFPLYVIEERKESKID